VRAATSISPVGMSRLTLSPRETTTPAMAMQYSLRRSPTSARASGASAGSLGSMVTWVMPKRSRRLMKVSAPWARRRCTQPKRTTEAPTSAWRRAPQSCVRPFSSKLDMAVTVAVVRRRGKTATTGPVNDVPAAGDGILVGISAGSSEAELAAASQRLEDASPLEILGWTFEQFRGRRVALSSAFGAEGCALIHLARQIEPAVPVYTIDTGYLFAESIALREAYRAMGADIRVVEPLISIRSQAERHGPDLFARDPDACCEIRKVEPMRRILTFLDVWITAVRRDQSETRKHTPIVGTARRSDGSLVVKVAPLARWSRKRHLGLHLRARAALQPPARRGLHQHRLRAVHRAQRRRQPATTSSERGGRWAGTGKTECGIHHL
jgi:phosphoadenosine phosphosulfate reductase